MASSPYRTVPHLTDTRYLPTTTRPAPRVVSPSTAGKMGGTQLWMTLSSLVHDQTRAPRETRLALAPEPPPRSRPTPPLSPGPPTPPARGKAWRPHLPRTPPCPKPSFLDLSQMASQDVAGSFYQALPLGALHDPPAPPTPPAPTPPPHLRGPTQQPPAPSTPATRSAGSTARTARSEWRPQRGPRAPPGKRSNGRTPHGACRGSPRRRRRQRQSGRAWTPR